jgi:hypothetical protein
MWIQIIELIAVMVIPIIAGIIVAKANKYLKLELDKQNIEEILEEIKDIILTVEERYPTKHGQERKLIVVDEVEKSLPQKEKTFLTEKFGTVSNAVQQVFRIAQPIIEARKIVNLLRR